MATDVRDILALDDGGDAQDGAPGVRQKKKRIPREPQEKEKRPEGMGRELFNLTGGRPPIAQTKPVGGYKMTKASLSNRKAVPWKWMDFTNPARKDALVLRHWRKAQDEGKEYPFAKFNRVLNIPTYTDEEYAAHVKGQGTWTREETDTLFDLCKRFDLRFVTVHDRYSVADHPQRTMEDLKARYYSVCSDLAIGRTPPGSTPDRALLAALRFDGDHETLRKQQLEKILSRTPAQVAEEKELAEEVRRIEQRGKDRDRERTHVERLMSGDATAAASAMGSLAAMETAALAGDAAGGAAPDAIDTPGDKKALKKRRKSDGATAGDAGASGAVGDDAPVKKERGTGAFLRSSRFAPMTVGLKAGKRVDMLLEDLGITTRLMPTARVCDQFDALRKDILMLLDIKKHTDNREYELKTLRHRKESLLRGETVPPDATPAEAKTPSAVAVATGVKRPERRDSLALSVDGRKRARGEDADGADAKRLKRA